MMIPRSKQSLQNTKSLQGMRTKWLDIIFGFGIFLLIVSTDGPGPIPWAPSTTV